MRTPTLRLPPQHPHSFGAVAGCVGLALAALGVLRCGSSTESPPRAVTYSTRTMGTYANVTLIVADSAAAVPTALIARRTFQRVDSLMSNWTETSEVARINRAAKESEASKRAVTVEAEVARVLDAAIRIGRQSGGAFDVTVEPLVRAWGFLGGKPHVPSEADAAVAFARVGQQHLTYDAASRQLRLQQQGTQIDFGGIAKGYAVDAVADTLRARGIENALIDLSGNMWAIGHPPTADAWRIGVRDPRDRLPYFARLQLRDWAVATSGKYEQFVTAGGKTYGHILDPRTGQPAEGLIAVTVVATSAMTADAWGTALFVLGPGEARRIAKERDDIAVLLVQPGPGEVDSVWVETDLRDSFQAEPAAGNHFHVEFF